LQGKMLHLTMFQLFPADANGGGLSFALRADAFSMVFALSASFLWILTVFYSAGYMRGLEEHAQTRFNTCFALALFGAVGCAFSDNLLTMYLFYEIVSICTYPLVAHHQDKEGYEGGRKYLVYLTATAKGLVLPAMVLIYVLSGSLDFAANIHTGIIPKTVHHGIITGLYICCILGFAKNAVMPFHNWLPSAMVAPTPVSALLHAVAVVKAGVFSVVKVVVYIFGLETLTASGANEWLIYVGSASILLASCIALTRDNLKARLAYSTVSQLAYIVVGAALANATGILGSGLHIATHAVGKITLFFCAGAIYTALHKTEISDMAGIGRKMPVTMTAFLIGSLSIIGLPPFAGTWSKWLLALGAIDSGHLFVVAVLMISSLLNVAYLLPIVGRAFFLPPPGQSAGAVKLQEAPVACLIALCTTAALCIVLFFGAGIIEHLLAGLFVRPSSTG
jgi:multicomponent Na+:H+ antiporter subunit D